MSKVDRLLPSGGPSREEIARRELGHTQIAPTTARILLAWFVAAILAVPTIELLGARARAASGVAVSWSHLLGLPRAIRTHLADNPPKEGRAWQRLQSANRVVLAGLSAFEGGLEDESILGQTLRPRTQAMMTRWLGAGNERVYAGENRWLFYRPDVEYLTGAGFLDPSQQQRRTDAVSEWETPPQPDPRRAIMQLQNQLARRGIALVVIPTPVKPGVHPEMLSRRYAGTSVVLQNPSFAAFVDDLRQNGVLVFDPSTILASGRADGPQYLAMDTHWRPEAMELVAEQLRDFIAANASLPPVDDPGYLVERVEVSNIGDVARMLDLPPGQPLHAPETVWLRRVLQPDGSAWRPSRDADVLVLGDSFANIYTLESLGWGTSAGLVEQLSFVLRRPLDRIVQNDDGAFATRVMLMQDPERLNGKRVVVYQFAARELSMGDWKMPPGSDGAN
jgi:alginate O-acetyltransferase complex protein AlgJ